MLKIQPGSSASVDEAIKLVEENLKANPYSFDDQRARAILLSMRPGRRDEAIRDLVSRDKVAPLDVEQRFLLALLHFADRDLKRCQEQLGKLLTDKRTTRDPNHLGLMIQVQLDRKDLGEVQRWLGELKQVEPQSARTLELEASLLKAQKRDTELVALLQAHARDHADHRAAVASLLDRFGFPAEAERAYREDVAENAKDPERLGRLIAFLGRQNRTQEALELWERVCKVMRPDLAADLGVSIVSMSAATEAQRTRVESWIAEALKAQPQSTILQLKLAFVRMNLGRPDDAQALYRQVLASAPDNVEALNNLASLLAFQDRTKDEAITLIDQAVALGGAAPALLDTRAVVRLQRGENDRALEDLRKAVSASPEFAILYYHLARAYHQAGNPSEAGKAFQQAERLGLKRDDVDLVEREEFSRLRPILIGE